MSMYTKEQFEKAVQDAGYSKENFSAQDWSRAMEDPDGGMTILSAKIAYENAKTPEERASAHSRADDYRANNWGYRTDASGMLYFKQDPTPKDFSPTQPKPTFSYDQESDPVFQAYSKQYAREGKRAQEDVLGSTAAASGGLPSSYAVTAASQAGDYYAAQMADKVPELYNQAFNRYLNELSQWNTDNQFNYGQHLDEINYRKAEEERRFQKAITMAEMGDRSPLQSMGYNVDNLPSEWQKKYNLTTLAASLGDYPYVTQQFGIVPDENMINSNLRYNLAAAENNNGNSTYWNQLLKQNFK